MKWPRQYAAEICRERDREKRRQMLDEVPEEYRDIVRTHVKNTFAIWSHQKKVRERKNENHPAKTER